MPNTKTTNTMQEETNASTKKEQVSFTIISDLLRAEEIKAAWSDVDIELRPLEQREAKRSALDPEVIAAIITGAVTVLSPILVLLVTKLMERFKKDKQKGLLIIKNEQAELHLPFEATEEEVAKKIELLKTFSSVEHLMITTEKEA